MFYAESFLRTYADCSQLENILLSCFLMKGMNYCYCLSQKLFLFIKKNKYFRKLFLKGAEGGKKLIFFISFPLLKIHNGKSGVLPLGSSVHSFDLQVILFCLFQPSAR